MNRSGLGVTTKLFKLTFDSQQCQRKRALKTVLLNLQKLVKIEWYKFPGAKAAAEDARRIKGERLPLLFPA